MRNTKQIKRMALLSMFIAVELVLMMTPLGYIPIGPLKATTLHIPVILITLLLGLKEGVILGAVFGFTSILMNTLAPTPVSFVFTPFYSIGGIHGNFNSILIAMLPRMMIAVSTYFTYHLFKKYRIQEYVRVFIASICGALCNTIFVMAGIYFFFGESYAIAKNIEYQTLFSFIFATITTNGILEALCGAIIVSGVYKALQFTKKGV